MTLLDNDGFLWVMGGKDAGEQRLGDSQQQTHILTPPLHTSLPAATK